MRVAETTMEEGSYKWPAEQILFLERHRKSLSWYGTVLNGTTEDSRQTTPAGDFPASVPNGSADSRCFPWLGLREENVLCDSHDQTLFTTGTRWARQIEGIQVKVEARRHLPSQFFWRMTQIL